MTFRQMGFSLAASAVLAFATPANAVTEIQWWHAMTGGNNDIVNKLNHEFAVALKRPDVIAALETWDGKGCFVVNMAPQPAGRVLNASGQPLHGVRIEMKYQG